jgi:O-antigen ligase
MSNFLLPIAAVVVAALILLILNAMTDLVSVLATLVFFLPYERIPTLQIADYTLKINHVVGFILIIFWLLDRIYHKRKLIPSPISLILLLFIAAQALSIIWAPLKTRALVFFVTNVFTIILSVVTIDIIRKRQDMEKIEKFIFISSWIVLIFSAWQFLGDLAGLPIGITGLVEGYSKITFGFPRVQAFSKEPLYLGNYLLLPLGFIVAKLLSSKTKNKASDYILLFGLFIVFILTLSRGALVGLGVFGVTLACFYPKQIFTAKTVTISLVTIVVAFTVVLVGIKQLGPKIEQKFIGHLLVQDLGKSESTVSRLSASDVAIKDWQEHPIFGVGVGNFGGSQTDYDINNPKTLDIVNNEYLELLAETGILGLGTFIILIAILLSRSIYALRLGYKNKSTVVPLLVGLTASLVGILTQFAFFSTLSIIHIWIAIGLLVAVQNLVIWETKKVKIDAE